jgi:hypothetical protein
MRPGVIGDACKCPIANSLKEVFNAKNCDPEVEGSEVLLPEGYLLALDGRSDLDWLSIRRSEDYGYHNAEILATLPTFDDFIRAFDNHGIPKLIDESS